MDTYPLTCLMMDLGQFTMTARGATARERSMKKLWKRVKRKENWESRMGTEYFVLIFLGFLISGLGSAFGWW
jgi:hypothetical protein